jgi:hypothetical protein
LIGDWLVARIVYHEIGHHILHQAGSAAATETNADEKAAPLVAKFLCRKYWYFAPAIWAIVMFAKRVKRRGRHVEGCD